MIIWKCIMLILKKILKPNDFFNFNDINLFLNLKIFKKQFRKKKYNDKYT